MNSSNDRRARMRRAAYNLALRANRDALTEDDHTLIVNDQADGATKAQRARAELFRLHKELMAMGVLTSPDMTAEALSVALRRENRDHSVDGNESSPLSDGFIKSVSPSAETVAASDAAEPPADDPDAPASPVEPSDSGAERPIARTPSPFKILQQPLTDQAIKEWDAANPEALAEFRSRVHDWKRGAPVALAEKRKPEPRPQMSDNAIAEKVNLEDRGRSLYAIFSSDPPQKTTRTEFTDSVLAGNFDDRGDSLPVTSSPMIPAVITNEKGVAIGPYDRSFGTSVGMSLKDGYRSEVVIQTADRSYSQLEIRHTVRASSRTYLFGKTFIYLKDVLTCPSFDMQEISSVTSIFRAASIVPDVAETGTVAALLRFSARPDGVKHSIDQWSLRKMAADCVVINGTPGADIARKVFDDLRDKTEVHFRMHFSSPFHTLLPKYVQRLRVCWRINQRNPMSSIFQRCPRTFLLDRNSRPTDKAIGMTQIQPSVTLFQNKQHRSGALAMGVMYDLEFHQALVAESEELWSGAVFFPDPQAYDADKAPTAFFVAIAGTELADIMPQVGDQSASRSLLDASWTAPPRS